MAKKIAGKGSEGKRARSAPAVTKAPPWPEAPQRKSGVALGDVDLQQTLVPKESGRWSPSTDDRKLVTAIQRLNIMRAILDEIHAVLRPLRREELPSDEERKHATEAVDALWSGMSGDLKVNAFRSIVVEAIEAALDEAPRRREERAWAKARLAESPGRVLRAMLKGQFPDLASPSDDILDRIMRDWSTPPSKGGRPPTGKSPPPKRTKSLGKLLVELGQPKVAQDTLDQWYVRFLRARRSVDR